MPKRRKDHSTSYDRSRVSPSTYNSRRLKTSLPKDPLQDEENAKEWEEARCPVCMEHPHNAVLLICSSHDKGCRPFMCDTSYRHSNCLDQFRKSFSEASSATLDQNLAPLETSYLPSSSRNLPEIMISEGQGDLPSSSRNSPEIMISEGQGASHEEGTASMQAGCCEDAMKPKLVCPLCRGQVNDWIVVELARKFMNAILRSCACETCDYSGTYSDLRKHARQVHPLVRPTDADPERQQDWRRLEQQRDFGDLLSTLQTSLLEEANEDSSSVFDEGSWLTVLFLVRILRPGSSSSNSSNSSWSVASRTRRAHVTIRRRPSRRHWGETYDWEADSRETNNEGSGGVSEPDEIN